MYVYICIYIDRYIYIKKPSECQIRDVFIRGVLLPEPSPPAYPRALFWVPTSVFTQCQILVRAGETIGISLPWGAKRDISTRASPGCSLGGPSFGKKQEADSSLWGWPFPRQAWGDPSVPLTQIICPTSCLMPVRQFQSDPQEASSW